MCDRPTIRSLKPVCTPPSSSALGFQVPQLSRPRPPLRYSPCCIALLSLIEQFAAMSTSAHGPLSLATLNPKVVFKASAQFCFVAPRSASLYPHYSHHLLPRDALRILLLIRFRRSRQRSTLSAVNLLLKPWSKQPPPTRDIPCAKT
jgi:hypothetical protein